MCTATTTTATAKTHNGTMTIRNPKTGGHRTLRVRTETWNKGKDNESTHRVVSLLTGSNNEADYTRFGFVADDGTVRVWKKYRGTAFDQYGSMLNHQKRWESNHGLEFLFATTCRVCNRKLTTPESIESGIGPVCAAAN